MIAFTNVTLNWMNQLIGNRYYVLGKIRSQSSRGNDCVIYRAIDLPLNRLVAVRIFRAAPDLTYSVFEAARAFAAGKDDHFPGIYECGELQQGYLYIVLDYVGGARVSELVGRFTAQEFIAFWHSLCTAIERVHARGAVIGSIGLNKIVCDLSDMTCMILGVEMAI
ncbi:MAG: hypothetical protein ACRD3W_08760, partial [Terriglobales bacterium]